MSILVGYIPTPEGKAALERAIAEARLREERLIVINSSRGDAFVDQKYVHPEQAAQLNEQLAACGVEHELIQPVRGNDAAQEVLDAAEQYHAELVVIGLRKRTAVGKLILGSTAQRILLQANCAVLAVKAR